jgi:hypothetical protein
MNDSLRIHVGEKNDDLSYYSPVMPGQSSERNGEAGNPSLLKRLQTGLSAHA